MDRGNLDYGKYDDFCVRDIHFVSRLKKQLNTWFEVWLSECHQNKPHAALSGDQTPEIAYRSDTKALRLVDAELLASAFLHSENRKVDKAGCISFMGKKYEVGLLFIGRIQNW
ncbi:hypothetical protein J2Z66_004831 [Paenibacillus eucommiae]|uniref:Integrase catalytic domain-containing protein n=1 Tax=Paenibacillus eucommiae TaxID=1355755 RepID=A0ABS4J052_9BACL|nr:hypothetical protein [Paenibacillus eucommiae]MBP1993214.1 hypothetical protein [Paenibacillus eucommiae]